MTMPLTPARSTPAAIVVATIFWPASVIPSTPTGTVSHTASGLPFLAAFFCKAVSAAPLRRFA